MTFKEKFIRHFVYFISGRNPQTETYFGGAITLSPEEFARTRKRGREVIYRLQRKVYGRDTREQDERVERMNKDLAVAYARFREERTAAPLLKRREYRSLERRIKDERVPVSNAAKHELLVRYFPETYRAVSSTESKQ